MVETTELTGKHCKPCKGGEPPLAADAIDLLLPALHEDWTLAADGKSITRIFSFAGYPPTIAFVNEIAVIAENEDHHPDLTVRYGKVGVLYTTHSIGGLSENDFICAAKIDRL